MKIKINNQNYSLPEIIQISDFKAFSDFEKNTIQFIQDWIAGTKQFSLQTSGTTGKPKTIQFSKTQMQISAEITAKAFNLIKGDTILICLNTNFVAGKMMLVRGLHLGLNMIINEPSSNPFDKLIEKVDFTAIVPLQLEKILQDGKTAEKLNHLKSVIVGGASLSNTLTKKIEQLDVPIYQTFSMTETLTHVAIKRLNGNSKNQYYNVLDGVSIEQDNRNCLVVSSPVTLGSKIYTNDLINKISETEFEWIGRIDNVINSGGLKIQSEEVEKIIARFFDNSKLNNAFCVIGIQDEKLGEKLILIIEGEKFDTSELNTYITKNLLKHYRPKEIKFIKEFERTLTGKIKRKEL